MAFSLKPLKTQDEKDQLFNFYQILNEIYEDSFIIIKWLLLNKLIFSLWMISFQ
jgi:hypothetical protein